MCIFDVQPNFMPFEYPRGNIIRRDYNQQDLSENKKDVLSSKQFTIKTEGELISTLSIHF